MHNVYNNNLYIVSTPTYFDASVSSSGNLNLVLAEVTKLLILLKLQLIKAVDKNVHVVAVA